MYAEIVVGARIRPRPVSGKHFSLEADDYSYLTTTFHYSVPPHLLDLIAVGQLVTVPFRTGRQQGVIVSLGDTSPVAETKDIETIVDVQPVLLPYQIELARWISGYYLAPLIEAVRLMLPPGLERKAETLVELGPEAHRKKPGQKPLHLTAEQRAIVELLEREGPLWASQMERRLGRGWRSQVDQLARQGVIVKRSDLHKPRVRPRRDRFVRLVADEITIAEELPYLGRGRAFKQANVLALLAESDDPLPTVAQVCAALGYTESPLRSLAEKGLVHIAERGAMIVPLLSPHRLDQVITEDLAPIPRAILQYLRDRPQGAEKGELYRQTRANAATVRALEDKGYLQRLDQEAAVWLAIPPTEVLDHIIKLRGAEKQVAVLDLLLEEGEPVWIGWVYAQTGCNLNTLKDLAAHGLVSLEEEEVWRDPLAGRHFPQETPPRLTPDQEAIWQELAKADHDVYLLHGVTGSGKTEIYLRAVQATLEQGRGAIILVPEVSLTPQTIHRFAARFPERIVVMHSQLSAGERYDGWRRVRAGEADIVIGPRSALFVPTPRLGLIVVDEEHDSSYKQDKRPYYQARDVAIKLAELSGAKVILGSATPDVVSYYRAKRGEYKLLELPQRIVWNRARLAEQRLKYRVPAATTREPPKGVVYSDLPPVRVVDLRQELRAGNLSIFSRALHQAMTKALAAGQQSILFLNRRGAATFVMCRDCGFVLRCARCDVPLTYHFGQEGKKEEPYLVCHYCNRRGEVAERCPQCLSTRIRFFGLGTQKVEAVCRESFPQARLLRWDRDVTGRKGSHEALLESFVNHQADVLIGTQMIAKGLDLPLVTLVGVISADTALYLPDFRAGERTFQLLTQVAGRAGRSILGGQVIVQTYTPQHNCIQAASHHDYAGFYRQELAFRREHGYPPFSRLARLVYVHSNRERCRQEAERLHETLRLKIARLGLADVALIGPAPCFLDRLRGKYRWQIVVRAARPHVLLGDLTLPLGWRVDIDPVDML